jgi:hypothetical protein
MSGGAPQNEASKNPASGSGASEGASAESDARRILDEQIKAQLEVSRHFRRACGKVSEKLFAELQVRITESPTPEDHGPFESNARLESLDGRAIAECRVFTGLNGVAYFVGAGPPEELEAATPERLEQALTQFSERALKTKAA